MYCRGCGYDLQGQRPDAHRCPECGRSFDPALPGTFRSRPPRSVWRWVWRAASLLLILALALAIAWGGLYWGWKSEQVAFAKLRPSGYSVEPLGGKRLQGWLGSSGWVLNRYILLDLPAVTADAALAQLRNFKWLEQLNLDRTQVSDGGVVHLREMKRLEVLHLGGTKVTDAGAKALQTALPKAYISRDLP